jgi:hypothetical protein
MSNKPNSKPKSAQATRVTRKSVDSSLRREAHKTFDDMERQNREFVSKAAMDYWNFLSDPFNNKPCRPVWFDGAYTGNTGLVSGHLKGVAQVGSGGYGFISLTMGRGPTTKVADAPISYTNGSYAGTAATVIDVGAVGVNYAALTDVPYDSTEGYSQLLWRPVAAAIKVTPRGSMTSQDGVITMLEIPGHNNLFFSTQYGVQSYVTTVQHPRTRIIRGAQLGDPSVVNQMNWHPQMSNSDGSTNSGGANYVVNDTVFRSFNLSNTTRQIGELLVQFEATANLQFEFEAILVWETKGAKAVGLRPSIQDAHASAIIFNTLCRQRLSGMVGKPHEFRASYQTAMHESARKTVAKAKDWLEVGKDVASIAKEVAGFLL